MMVASLYGPYGTRKPIFRSLRTHSRLTRDFKLCTNFIQFIVPLLHVVQVQQQEDNEGPLHGYVLYISVDSTIMVIVVHGFKLYVCFNCCCVLLDDPLD